jgi:AraC-like DNA-binding protein
MCRTAAPSRRSGPERLAATVLRAGTEDGRAGAPTASRPPSRSRRPLDRRRRASQRSRSARGTHVGQLSPSTATATCFRAPRAPSATRSMRSLNAAATTPRMSFARDRARSRPIPTRAYRAQHRTTKRAPTKRNSVTRENSVDLMGRLSNPPETLECRADQGERGTPPLRRTTSKGATRSSNLPESGDLEEKGQLSNPVQRRLSLRVVDELVRLYEEGASIDALGRRYGVHRTTIIVQLDRRGVRRRRVARKMTDPLVAQAAKRYAEGLSVADVASEFGVHARTLDREFRSAGTRIRARRGWNR